MKTVPVDKAVGLVLCHDITEIIPGKKKDVAFRKGHIVRLEDIETLKRIGKENLYVWGQGQGDLVHEDDAARRIAKAVAGQGVSYGEPKEGRINFTATRQGLLCINLELLFALNAIQYVSIATAQSLQEVAIGRMLAGTRVIPLAVPEKTLSSVEDCCERGGPLLQVLPFARHKVAVITTGSEVYKGRVKDGFGPVLRKKFADWGSEVISQVIVPDEPEVTTQAIQEAIANGATIVTVTGGMSVDPDDKTPAAIRDSGCQIVTYGTPVFPGAMFMLGYKGEVPVLGLPGCVMYNQISIFDLVMPRILAGIRLVPEDFIKMAHGGLCESCPTCHYPQCSFGKL